MVHMDLKDIQEQQKQFIHDRRWERFPASQVFVHLVEELGEVGSHLLYKTGYKVKGLGHEGEDDPVSRELAQVFNLFLQLCIDLDVDLETAWQEEYQRNQTRFDAKQWQDLAKNAEESESQ